MPPSFSPRAQLPYPLLTPLFSFVLPRAGAASPSSSTQTYFWAFFCFSLWFSCLVSQRHGHPLDASRGARPFSLLLSATTPHCLTLAAPCTTEYTATRTRVVSERGKRRERHLRSKKKNNRRAESEYREHTTYKQQETRHAHAFRLTGAPQLSASTTARKK